MRMCQCRKKRLQPSKANPPPKEQGAKRIPPDNHARKNLVRANHKLKPRQQRLPKPKLKTIAKTHELKVKMLRMKMNQRANLLQKIKTRNLKVLLNFLLHNR